MAKPKSAAEPAVMAIERLSVSVLAQDPKNSRKHNARNLETIKASLTRFGQQKPIVIGKNNLIIAGHGTLAAALALGWKTIACVRSTLEGGEAKGYGIADNRTAELAEWDHEALAETLDSLRYDGFDLDALGFSQAEIDALQPDAPEPVREIKQLETKPPPRMAWVLIGIPTVAFGDIAEAVETIAARPGVLCETVVNDG